jgi:hypothetical protein
MGHAERRTVVEFPRLAGSEAAAAPQVTTLFAPQPVVFEAPLDDVDPKARRVAAILFLGAVVAFWGSAAAAVSTFLF